MSSIGILKIMEVQEDDMEVQEEAVVGLLCYMGLFHSKNLALFLLVSFFFLSCI